MLYGGGVDPFRDLEKDGLLTRYDPPAGNPRADSGATERHGLIDPDHEWFGAALSGFGIITNERARQAAGLPEVHTWADLADPRLAGWISACDPRASGSALAIYEIILQSYGWDKGWAVLMEMSGNTRNFLSSSAASAVEVGMGDAAYGVAIDIYGQAQAGLLRTGQRQLHPARGPDGDHARQHRDPEKSAAPGDGAAFLEFVLSRDGPAALDAAEGRAGRRDAQHASIA